METSRMRTGGAIVLFIVGAAFTLFGAAAVVVALVLLIGASSGPAPLIVGPLGLLLLVLGILFFVIAARTGAVVDARGISFAAGLSPRRTIPWEQVREVHVPGDDDPAPCVQLLLVDGSVVPVRAISKMKNSETHRRFSTEGYRRAGRNLVEAHRAWLTTRGSRRS